MEEVVQKNPFLEVWHNAMIVGAIVMFAVGLLIYLIYSLRVSMRHDFKEKHDFINSNEIKWFKWVYYSFGIGVGMIINLYGADSKSLTDVGVWFWVRLFIGFSGATLVGYIATLVLDYYYPTRLHYKLRRWRYMPRVNPKTGNKMRLLSEDEEDIHLDAGMQAEENIFSIDYDVWVDEKSGDVKIEKYQGHLLALQCRNCGFYTMKVTREEISEKAEDGSPVELIKHYQCTYCKNVRATAFHISKRETPDDYEKLRQQVKRNTRGIEVVRIEVVTSTGTRKNYEFQSLDQANKFLAELDVDKL
ncbi:MAG: hypothetical protein U0V64_15830 [Cyclobacteriaceae bacterium]